MLLFNMPSWLIRSFEVPPRNLVLVSLSNSSFSYIPLLPSVIDFPLL